ncbi:MULTISPECIES: hypothetical protein [unclassified Streptomyces]|uniref:Uncharacterized protein n=1 Tax=Streptomyces sp. 900105245 TaxID=3154379 RepID=A0ABV1UF45_9ACTN|nr:hypothetical protein [Streptomyces sp. CB01883]OKJ71919.1 hypothetical protein AMK32_38700 [Streptomyces sp. CB01883]
MSVTSGGTHVLRARLGPVWRDANIRSGPSLDSPVLRVVLPDPAVDHACEGWSGGDEVVEDQHPDGVITSSVWFRLADGGWSSAVNFEPVTVTGLLAHAVSVAAPGQPSGQS